MTTYAVWILYVIFVLLNGADVVTTRILLASGAREANPLMAWLVGKLGWTAGLILPKLIMAVALFLLIRTVQNGALVAVVLFGLCAFYAIIVNRNYHMMEVR